MQIVSFGAYIFVIGQSFVDLASVHDQDHGPADV